jgi:hypothetical protein
MFTEIMTIGGCGVQGPDAKVARNPAYPSSHSTSSNQVEPTLLTSKSFT